MSKQDNTCPHCGARLRWQVIDNPYPEPGYENMIVRVPADDGAEAWAAFEELLDATNLAYGGLMADPRSVSILLEVGEAIAKARLLINEHDRQILRSQEQT